MPALEEDVVLLIHSDDIFDRAQLFRFLLHSIRQGHGREDSNRSIGHLHQSPSATNLDPAKSKEGRAEGDDLRRYMSNHHHLVRIRGNEFLDAGRHFGLLCRVVEAVVSGKQSKLEDWGEERRDIERRHWILVGFDGGLG